jgi:hypothetical protein
MKTTAAPAPAPAIISHQLAKGDQRVVLLEVLDDRAAFGCVWQVRIESDSYRHQCSAKIQKWAGDEWTHVHSILAHGMKTPEGLCYKREPVTARDFAGDRDELLRVARAIKRTTV